MKVKSKWTVSARFEVAWTEFPHARSDEYGSGLGDTQWRLLEPLPGRGRARGPAPVLDRWQVVSAMLCQAKTGCQWRMLPVEFGNWNTIWRTFSRSRAQAPRAETLTYLARLERITAGSDREPSVESFQSRPADPGRTHRREVGGDPAGHVQDHS